MLTRIVRTGLASTVSTPAIAAQWTMCVAPCARRAVDEGRRALRELAEGLCVEQVALRGREVGVLAEMGPQGRARVGVVGGVPLFAAAEGPGERRRDEAGAAGDEHALSLQ